MLACCYGLFGRQRNVSDRVWEGARGLEWTVPSPAPYHTFEDPPELPDSELTAGGGAHYAMVAGCPPRAAGNMGYEMNNENASSKTRGNVIQIGKASCRETVCQYLYISLVAVALKKK